LDYETTFQIAKLVRASVVAGACCTVPVEAVLIPELEGLAGVQVVNVEWQSGRVVVRHAASVDAAALAGTLADLDYPAEEWNTAHSSSVVTLD
jgi:hypothetical protein